MISFPFTTSLNLLFFYMTWTTLVLSHPPLRVEIFGTAAVRIVFYLFPSLLCFLFDIVLPTASAVIKAQGQVALPSGSKRGRLGLKEAKIVAWSLFNLILGILVQGVIEYILTKVLLFRSAIKVAYRLPYPWGIATDVVRGFIVREILTYVTHRFALHSSNSPIARYHQSWHHSLRAPWPLTAHYDHPVAYLVWKFIPIYIPAALFRFHMITYMIFVGLVSLEETFTYSGYQSLPTGFLLGGVARRMESHVMSGGEGNYGAWGLLDWLGGTTVGESVEDDIRDELDEHDVDDKIRKMVEESQKRIGEARGKTRRRVNNNNNNN